MPDAPVTSYEPGLFGKLPAHGDFVQRGWDDATVRGLDNWLSEGLASVRSALDDDGFDHLMTKAPLWRSYLPAGWVSTGALLVVLAPSVDQVGRYFFIAAGLSGAAAPLWDVACRQSDFLSGVDKAVYESLATGSDADTLFAETSKTAGLSTDDVPLPIRLTVPTFALFWLEGASGASRTLRFDTPDVDSVRQLLLAEVV